MKQHISLYFFLGAILALLISCSRQEPENIPYSSTPEDGLVPLSLSASKEDCRMTLTPEDGSLQWSASDQLAVYASDSHFHTFELTEGAGTSTASFSGRVREGASLTDLAVCPAGLAPVRNGQALTVTFPSSLDEDGWAVPMLATFESGASACDFKHLCGGIRFTLNNVPVSATSFVFCSEGKRLSGNYTLEDFTQASATIQVAESTAADSTVRIRFVPAAEVTTRSFCVPLPCGSYGEFSVKLLDAQDHELWSVTSRNTAEPKVVRRAHIINMNPINVAATTFIDFRFDAEDITLSSLSLTTVTGSTPIYDGQTTLTKQWSGGLSLAGGSASARFLVEPFTENVGLVLTAVLSDNRTVVREVNASRGVTLSAGDKLVMPLSPWLPGGISTADELVELQYLDHQNLSVDRFKNASGAVALLADIDMTGADWTYGLGRPSMVQYVFDGGHHTISKLASTNRSFCFVLGPKGVIKDLTLAADCQFTVSNNQSSPLCSYNRGTISGCVNRASYAYTRNSDWSGASLVLAGLVSKNDGTMSGCVNYGDVSVTIGGSTIGLGVAGVVAYSRGNVTDCANYGNVSFACSHISANAADTIGTVIMSRAYAPAVGGITALMYDGAVISGCDNYGSVSCTTQELTKTPNAVSSVTVGGIVGSPCSSVSSCNNRGDVIVNAWNSASSRARYTTYSANISIGGIAGGANYADDQTAVSITECANSGSITADLDEYSSYCYVGGIVGWPRAENTSGDGLVSACSCNGDITLHGYGKVRLGGISGGTGKISGCTFSGNITCDKAGAYAYMGGIVGYHIAGMTLTNCIVNGSNISYTGKTGANSIVYGMGGLIGDANLTGDAGCTGCQVLCHISSNHWRDMGLIAGRVGDKKTAAYASAESPIVIVDGCSLTDTASSFSYTLTTSADNSYYQTPVLSQTIGSTTQKCGLLFGSLYFNTSYHTYHTVRASTLQQ